MAEQSLLQRRVSLPLLVFYGVGTILGAGIYVLVGKVAGAAGMYAPFAFLVATVLAAFSALSYAELAARFPKSAGEALYVAEGLRSRFLARLMGLMIAAVGIVSSATMIQGFVGYLHVFIAVPDVVIVVALVAAMAALTIWGIGQSVWVASAMTLVEIAGLLVILWVTGAHGVVTAPALHALLPPPEIATWVGIFAGGYLAFYAFIGFEDIVKIAEEVHRPRRTLPRAILWSLGVTTVLYAAVSVAAVLTVAPDRLAQSGAPLSLVYEEAGGGYPTFITLVSLVSVSNGALIQVIMVSRMLYGMSREGWLPAALGRVSPRTHTPWVATLLTATFQLFLTLALPLLTLAKTTSFITLCAFALVNLALWRIKGRPVSEPAAVSVPRWVPLLGFLASTGFVVFQLLQLLAH